MIITVAGDFCDRYRVSKLIEKKDFEPMFFQMKSILRNSDYNIVNFEFPIVKEKGHPIRKNGPNLKGQINSIEALKYVGFNVCTLANNHILDQGDQCCVDTISELNNLDIYTVGCGKDSNEASKVLYLQKEDETLAIINCCEHEFCIATDTKPGANPFSLINQYHAIKEARMKADYVIVIVHGGHEHFQLPSPRMQKNYRFYIDVGADVVINHHQHCYSGYEEYKDKFIFYGLGNFLFDEPAKRNDKWNKGYLVRLCFSKRESLKYELIPYEQCNENVGCFPISSTFDIDDFKKHIKELNEIIINPQLLHKKYETWVIENSHWYLLTFVPYLDRITRGLFLRGYLPKFINKTKAYTIANFINCESHLERLRLVVSHFLLNKI